ncbi:MAG TPA: copper resistance protein NlpE N-terminal domain-containing protein [Flavobacteriales bacterium]|nr:copper resistance protein NlpE N-terminal domain-containing protein [Flavobacteriales bacterium]
MRPIILFLPLALFACNAPAPPLEASAPTHDSLPAGDNSRNALDWAGTYRGTLPCADCEGIDTRITLSGDGTYRHEAIYLGKSKEPIVTEGAFAWESDGGRITLTGLEGMHRYRVGEEVLIMLDAEGNAIKGELPERYRLPREAQATGSLPTALEGPRWVLVELMGKAVDAKSNPKEAFITFDAKEKRATGNAGCNSFFGGYESDANGRLRFDKLGMTMMACMDPNREAEFTKAIEQVDNYTMADSTLLLNKARMAPLMRLRAR